MFGNSDTVQNMFDYSISWGVNRNAPRHLCVIDYVIGLLMSHLEVPPIAARDSCIMPSHGAALAIQRGFPQLTQDNNMPAKK